MLRLAVALAAVLAAVLAAGLLWAVSGALASDGRSIESLPAPAGDVVLTVRGDIARTNGGGAARFDLGMLGDLPHTEFATSTVWTEGVSTYGGVLLRDLLDGLGAGGVRAVASAIDGYHAVIPLDELNGDGPIVAFLRDGAPMPVRERGPLWIVFPYDDNPAYRNDTTYARSVWQLSLIEIE